MKRIALSLLAALALAGCATSTDYKEYADTQKHIANARAMTEAARYAALAEIAKTGDSAAKVAAVISIQMGSMNGAQPGQAVAAPVSPGETALRWASVLVPSLTQLYSIQRNADVATVQSNNNKDVQINTNQTMFGLGALQQGAVVGTPGTQLIYPEPAANRVVTVPEGSATVIAPAGVPANPQ
jgi:hypothetical protein